MLPFFVKPQPKFFKYLPFLSRQQGTTFSSKIYLRNDIFKDLNTVSPNPYNSALLEHELTHHRRIKETGVLKFSILYIFSKKFRFNEELIANKKAFEILKKNKLSYDIDSKAKVLSSWLYLWPVSYKKAKEELDKAWEQS